VESLVKYSWSLLRSTFAIAFCPSSARHLTTLARDALLRTPAALAEACGGR
jgi:hypothetical protein